MNSPLQRGIDHFVFAVHDLDATCALFNRLGFTTTPRTGYRGRTSTSVVQFQDTYIELYAVTNQAKVTAASQGGFSFGRYNAEFLRRRQGMSMLAFASDDARRDLAEFTAAGLTAHGPFDFKTDAALPGFWDKEFSFSLAIVTDARTPDAVHFVCQLRSPENFWKPECQRHPNSAQQIAEVVMVADQPTEFAGLFGALQRPEQVRVENGELRVATARGQVTVLTPAAFTERYSGIAPICKGPHFAAVRIAVRDLGTAQAIFNASGLRAQAAPGRVWVEPKLVGGALLEVSASKS